MITGITLDQIVCYIYTIQFENYFYKSDLPIC